MAAELRHCWRKRVINALATAVCISINCKRKLVKHTSTTSETPSSSSRSGDRFEDTAIRHFQLISSLAHNLLCEGAVEDKLTNVIESDAALVLTVGNGEDVPLFPFPHSFLEFVLQDKANVNASHGCHQGFTASPPQCPSGLGVTAGEETV